MINHKVFMRYYKVHIKSDWAFGPVNVYHQKIKLRILEKGRTCPVQ